MLLDIEIIHKIVEFTNIYIEKMKGNFARDRDAKLTNEFYICVMSLNAERRLVTSKWDLSKGTRVDTCYMQ